MVMRADKGLPAGNQIPVIMSEMEAAALTLKDIGPAISIFGSARTSRDAPLYLKCQELSRALAQAGFAVIAGGGPGMMEAANRGAFDVGGTSVGLNIVLPHESSNNAYQSVSLSFEYFYSRKATFFMHSFAYVAMPGGFGTLDELFEALTLIQTGKVPPAPVVLVGREFWGGLIGWIKEQVLGNGMISAHDLDLFIIDDDVPAIVEHLKDAHERITSEQQYAPSLPA